MNRRGFFNSLSLLTGAAVVAPQIFLPKLEHTRWKRTFQGLIVPNPEYVNAKYEWAFCFNENIETPKNIIRPPRTLINYPVRGNEFDSNGNLISIAPFLAI